MRALKFLVVPILMACCVCFGNSPSLSNVASWSLAFDYQQTAHDPLNSQGSLYYYILDGNSYPVYALFQMRIQLQNASGEIITKPCFSVNVAKIDGNDTFQPVVRYGGDFISTGTNGRTTGSGYRVCANKDGVALPRVGLRKWFAALYESNIVDSYVTYNLSVNGAESTGLNTVTAWWYKNQMSGYPFWTYPFGSSYKTWIELNTPSQQETAYIPKPLTAGLPAQSPETWYEHNIDGNDTVATTIYYDLMDEFDSYACQTMLSYYAVFPYDSNNTTLPVNIISYDSNNAVCRTLISAKKVGNGQYKTDYILPVSNKNLQGKWVDPNTGISYHAIYTASNYSYEALSLWGYTQEYMAQGGRYDFNGDGIVNELDYAVLCKNGL